MSRRLVDSGVEWIGKMPANWKLRRIGNLFEQRSEKVSDIEYEPLSVTKNGIVKQLATAAKSNDHTNRKKVCLNDFVINSRSDRKMSSGVSPLEGSVSLINIVLHSTDMDPSFVNYLLKNYGFAEEFYRWGTGIVEDLWSTNYSRMKKILIPIPSLEEQKKIANLLEDKVSKINNITEKLKLSIEELKKYKQSLITETVTKGLDPNVEMKNSETSYIGDIPFNWNISRIRYLGFLQNGISKSGEYFGSGHPFVSYSDVYKNIELPKNVDGLVESTNEERERYSVRKGDVFFTRTSETIQEVGFASTCMEEVPGAVFAGFVIRFRPETQELNPAYAKYYFRSEIHRKFFVKEMNIVTRASLSQGLLKRLPVLLPSQEEQREISQFLDEKCYHIDSLIEKKQKIIAEMESYKKSLIYEYVTGKKEVV
ncbi:EcoKI restriction-modification system protein HsdS [Oceanobacillus picturae]|uniref:EcoKI restriction-modification system protein HsdS n=1 Tax=Oceanobacillus picturae TaxID=171693 RepID=A0A0U9H7K1_9BACI|nr:restriction endonuclease subunit S [Oceanobacillus picturae]GAQ18463.1 EcoKI restriction-modification system protein HsdS [Oceanobacillus picturae]